jgi:hypothetical protein
MRSVNYSACTQVLKNITPAELNYLKRWLIFIAVLKYGRARWADLAAPVPNGHFEDTMKRRR